MMYSEHEKVANVIEIVIGLRSFDFFETIALMNGSIETYQTLELDLIFHSESIFKVV